MRLSIALALTAALLLLPHVARAQESTGAAPSASPSPETTSEPASEPTTDASMSPTEVTTDSAAPSDASTDAMPITTDAAGESPLTTDSAEASVGSEPATTDTTSGKPRGEAATFRLTFMPQASVVKKLTETNSEQLRLVLPPAVEDGPPEERSRLTTTTIVSQISFEPVEGGFRQTEVVDQYRRFEEGLAMPDPLEGALKGAKLFSKLDPNGAFMGVEDAPTFLQGIVGRTPELERPAVQAALSAEAIEREAREGWQRKVGRYLTVPLRIGHASFLVEYEDLGPAGKLPYILCAIPSNVESVNGKACVRVDLVSFAASLKDGVVSGVPDEIDAEFMQWCEGKDVPFSPPELSCWGAGEVLLELNGTGTVHYKNEENFHLSPAKIDRPMGGPVDADELSVKRVATLDVE